LHRRGRSRSPTTRASHQLAALTPCTEINTYGSSRSRLTTREAEEIDGGGNGTGWGGREGWVGFSAGRFADKS
jgi:hypothetical protein